MDVRGGVVYLHEVVRCFNGAVSGGEAGGGGGGGREGRGVGRGGGGQTDTSEVVRLSRWGKQESEAGREGEERVGKGDCCALESE